MRVFLLGLILAAVSLAAKSMDVYFIDTEGGKATLIVSPSGQTLLIDTGYPGNRIRDAYRILAAAKLAGVKQIDYLLITHFHEDHAGGVPQLAARLPIKHFIDHGPNTETGAAPDALYKSYKDAWGASQHTVAAPGQKIPIKGLDVQVLTSNGEAITSPLKGAGAPNSVCASTQKQADVTTENARSMGFLIAFGKFRMLDLGDLTWNKELALVCPNNLIGTVDVYATSHHGNNDSGSPALINAIKPRVAIMNNGATKGGAASAWRTLRGSPGFLDLWQLHFAVAGGKDNNVDEQFIANPGTDDVQRPGKLDQVVGRAGRFVHGDQQPEQSFEVVQTTLVLCRAQGEPHRAGGP